MFSLSNGKVLIITITYTHSLFCGARDLNGVLRCACFPLSPLFPPKSTLFTSHLSSLTAHLVLILHLFFICGSRQHHNSVNPPLPSSSSGLCLRKLCHSTRGKYRTEGIRVAEPNESEQAERIGGGCVSGFPGGSLRRRGRGG